MQALLDSSASATSDPQSVDSDAAEQSIDLLSDMIFHSDKDSGFDSNQHSSSSIIVNNLVNNVVYVLDD